MVLTIHHLGHSQSERIVWLAEELGIDYNLEKYDRSPLLSPPKYLALHPIGAAPVITDTDSNGKTITLAESAACVEWIVNKHGGGRLMLKPDDEKYADYLYWYHFTNGSFTPAVGRSMMLTFAGVDEDNNASARSFNRLQQLLQHMDNHLSPQNGNPWLAGATFTVADVMAVFSLTTHREFYGYSLEKYENVLVYLQRVAGREAYCRAMEKGDPDVDFKANMLGPAPLPFAPLRRGAKV